MVCKVHRTYMYCIILLVLHRGKLAENGRALTNYGRYLYRPYIILHYPKKTVEALQLSPSTATLTIIS